MWMTTVMKNDKKKKKQQESQIICTGMEPPKTVMSRLQHQAEV